MAGNAALPTASEQRQLVETSELYHANLFQLQADELLAEITLSHTSRRAEQLEACLRSLKDVLFALPKRDVSVESLAAGTDGAPPVTGISLSAHAAAAAAHGRPTSLAFAPPRRMHIVGSYLLRTSVVRGVNRAPPPAATPTHAPSSTAPIVERGHRRRDPA